MFAVGIDIGGMSIKIGLVDDCGKIIAQSYFKTENTPCEMIKLMAEHISILINDNSLETKDLIGIGIGCPGSVNVDTGMIEILPNIFGWVKIPIVSKLKKYYDVPIKISNDANVAVLAESLYGAAKNYDNAIMFTLGTGVGGGIILDKKLVEGGHSLGAELGHTTLILEGEECTCGRKGCIERYVSATALIEQTKRAMLSDKNSTMWDFVGGNIDKVDGKTAFESAKKGDLTAKNVCDKYIYYLGESILNMLNIFRPDVFILGGGISAQGKFLTDKLQDYCERFEYGYKMSTRTKIVTAILGNDAGIIGAAALVRQ
ncbi:MAG: ROK family protein [Clostridiales bacterium]|nr:ROK family protein [Clostridiales bacterium]